MERRAAGKGRIAHSALMSRPKCIYKENSRISADKCTWNSKQVSFIYFLFGLFMSRGQEIEVWSL